MTPEARQLVYAMVKDMALCPYGYKSFVEGCYDMFTKNYGMKEPTEGKDFVVKEVIKILKNC